MSEPNRIVTWMGKPVESLTRQELIDALNEAARLYEDARAERSRMSPYVDYRAMLMRDRVNT